MVNEGYNGTVGTVHSNSEDPFQLTYAGRAVGDFSYPTQTASYHDQQHLQSTSDENCIFDPIGWLAPSYLDMAPAISSGQHIVRSCSGWLCYFLTVTLVV